MPAPTTGLVGQYIAGTGVTASSQLISQWNDQSGIGNHLTQSTDALKPYDTVDAQSNPIVRFPLVNVTNGDRRISGTLASSFSGVNATVWIACRTAAGNGAHTLIDFTGPTAGQLRGTSGVLSVQARTSTKRQAMNKSVYCGHANTNSRIVTSYADELIAGAPSAGTATAVSIGGRGSGGSFATLDVYEVLIYSPRQSDSDITATKAYLETKYNIRTSYDNVIIFEGDSITAGTDATQSQSYPFQLMNDPECEQWLAYAFASSGATVSTMSGRSTARSQCFQSGKRNVLVYMIGRNDVTSSDAATVYAAEVTYVQTVVSEGWEVWVCTPIATGNSTNNNRLAEIADRIRGVNGYTGIVADAGASRVIDVRANSVFDDAADSNNLTYYSGDQTHLTNTGYGVVASVVKPYMLAGTPGTSTLSGLVSVVVRPVVQPVCRAVVG